MVATVAGDKIKIYSAANAGKGFVTHDIQHVEGAEQSGSIAGDYNTVLAIYAAVPQPLPVGVVVIYDDAGVRKLYRCLVAGAGGTLPNTLAPNWEEVSPSGAGLALTAVVPSPPGTAAVGTGTAAAREDHVHRLPLATEIVTVPSGGALATSTNLQAYLDDNRADIDSLSAISATNYIAGGANPVAGQGVDGNYYLNVVSGDIFGPKAAGAWPGAATGNAYAQLGLSTVAGSAPTAAGTVGVGTVAARSDHTHPFQTALQTPSTAVAPRLTATNVDAALAQLLALIPDDTALPDLTV